MSVAPLRYTPATFDTILETTAHDYGHAVRSVHAKAHGILEGTLICNVCHNDR